MTKIKINIIAHSNTTSEEKAEGESGMDKESSNNVFSAISVSCINTTLDH